jgi:hypothetical protein
MVFPAPHPLLRLALVVVAALELLDALTSAHNIFTDYHHPTALLRFAQALTSVSSSAASSSRLTTAARWCSLT